MPNWKKLIVSGSDAVLNTVTAIAFTGSLFGTASYATTALSASYAPGGAAFPFTGSAIITGSLIITGSTTSSRDFLISNVTVGAGKNPTFRNTIVGREASFRENGGDSNVAVGYQAMYSGSTGYSNTGVGVYALYGNNTGIYNTGIGYGAGNNVTGNYNVAVGSETFNNNTGGSNRIAVGHQSQYQSSGNNNISIGYQSLFSLTTGTGNIAIGHQAGYSETTSNKLYIANSSTSTPLIGGDFTNKYLGVNIAPGSTSATLHIKGSGTTSSTTALRVENSTSTARLTILDNGTAAFNTNHLYVSSSGNVGIGTASPTTTLDVNGTVKALSFTGSFTGSYTGTSLTITGDASITGNTVTNIQFNNQTTNMYTLGAADASKLVEMDVSIGNTVTVPTNASVGFAIGTQIMIVQQGTGQTTIAAAGGVTLRSAGGLLNLASQYSSCTVVKRGTDEWYVFGDLA